MRNEFIDGIGNEYLKKIISRQKDLYFQFTVSADYSISFDYINGMVYDFCELTFDEIEKNPKIILDEKIHPEDLNKFKKSLNHCVENLGRWELDYRINLTSGAVKWIRVSADTEKLIDGSVAFFGTQTDISFQKHQEAEYKVSEARSQFANLASGIGVWDWNMVTNDVFYSAQSLKILELEDSNADLIANPEKWDERVHPDDREIYFGNINEHFEGKIPYYETYHRILCNGRYKWILDRGKVISRDENGKPLRIIGTHTDVTSQKIKEQKLQETLDLVNNQKSKLLNFAHIVSHNLKNHTGNLSALLKMYKDEYMTLDEVMPSLGIVSDELTTTIENLVELVNIQVTTNLEKQNLAINEYFEKVILLLGEDIKKNDITIINKIPSSFSVWFMPAYLDSILLNLTTNAIKYSSPDRDSFIEYFVEENDDYRVLCVKDNGLGIDLAKYKDVIFGLYKTFHRHEDSTGIGLYITKNQIEAMGGKIEVESEVNVGSTFRIYFKK